MSRGAVVLLVALVVVLHVRCSTVEGPPGTRADVLVEEILRLNDPFREAADSEESIERSTYASNGILAVDEPQWLWKLPSQERELLDLGRASVRPILQALSKHSSSRDIRARLAQLLPKLGDPDIAPSLGELASEEPDALVRLCIVQSMVLLKPGDGTVSIGNLAQAHRIPAHIPWWSAAMAGEESARRKYFDFMESLLRSEQLEQSSDDTTPKLGLGPSAAHLHVRARRSGQLKTFDLYLELWRLAQLHDPRSVGLLIQALAYHDPPSQHVAISFLSREVSAPEGLLRQSEYDLHTLELHRRWTEWWARNKALLKWDSQKQRYCTS